MWNHPKGSEQGEGVMGNDPTIHSQNNGLQAAPAFSIKPFKPFQCCLHRCRGPRRLRCLRGQRGNYPVHLRRRRTKHDSFPQ
ncbi:hypothetical protein EV05_0010 [Prochlorococcus sp. MIT 0601]|nr:hypothetical protein EV05_0010 [Prochlorococcus sp. MIT 0601]